jgi:hypothetical protein
LSIIFKPSKINIFLIKSNISLYSKFNLFKSVNKLVICNDNLKFLFNNIFVKNILIFLLNSFNTVLKLLKLITTLSFYKLTIKFLFLL